MPHHARTEAEQQAHLPHTRLGADTRHLGVQLLSALLGARHLLREAALHGARRRLARRVLRLQAANSFLPTEGK